MANKNANEKQKHVINVEYGQGDGKPDKQNFVTSLKNTRHKKKKINNTDRSQKSDQSSKSENVENNSKFLCSSPDSETRFDKVNDKKSILTKTKNVESKTKSEIKSPECKLNFKQTVKLNNPTTTKKSLIRLRRENEILKKYCPNYNSNIDNENLKKNKRITQNDQSDIYLETSSYQTDSDSYSILSTYPPQSLPTDDSVNSSLYRSRTSSLDDIHALKTDVSKISFKYGEVKIKGKCKNNFNVSTTTTVVSTVFSNIIEARIAFGKPCVTEDFKKLKEPKNKFVDCKIDENKDEITEIKTNIAEDNDDEENILYLKDVYGIDLPIKEEYRKKLNFVETLIISENLLTDEQKAQIKLERDANKISNERYTNLVNSDEVIEIGGFRLAIESDACKFITVCSTQFSYKNGIGGSKLIGINDMDLKMIEDKKTEWHLKLPNKIEQILHVFKEKKEYVGYKTKIENGNTVDKQRANIVLKTTGDFMLDGGLFILMRYLILKKFEGTLTVWSMNISGELLKCILDVGKTKPFKIGDRIHEAIRIRKTFVGGNSEPIVSKTYYSSSGHILRHTWRGSKIFLHLNPFSMIPPSLSSPYSYNLQKDWNNDLILFSKYLDLKAEKRAEIESYINKNYEFKSILNDFILTAIMQKPEDVLEFAIDYFLDICDYEEED